MQSSHPPAGTGTIPPIDRARPSAWPPEQAVLGHLLDAHPRRLDSVALAGELRGRLEPADIERAVANLSYAGLVKQAGEVVEPAPRVLDFEARLS